MRVWTKVQLRAKSELRTRAGEAATWLRPVAEHALERIANLAEARPGTSTALRRLRQAFDRDARGIRLAHAATSLQNWLRSARTQRSGAAWPSVNPISTPALLERLCNDEGCRELESSHLACVAAREISGRSDRPDEVMTALEDAVLQSNRPPCVRSAAVDGLVNLGTLRSHDVLRRLTAVARRRTEWSGTHGDQALLEQLLRHSTPPPRLRS